MAARLGRNRVEAGARASILCGLSAEGEPMADPDKCTRTFAPKSTDVKHLFCIRPSRLGTQPPGENTRAAAMCEAETRALAALWAAWQALGRPPHVRDLARVARIPPATVHRALKRLASVGRVVYLDGKPYPLRLAERIRDAAAAGDDAA